MPTLSRRQALLAVLGMPMANALVLARTTRQGTPGPAPKAAILTVPLDQWGWLRFTHKGREVMFDVGEVFDILREG